MKRMTAIVGAIVLLVVSANPVAFAAPPESIADKVDAQQRRIDQGIASGALTRGEADTLSDNLFWIKSTHARMRADGRLTPAEIRKLDEMLERNGAMIFNKKSNPITRVYQADIPERIADQQWRIDQGIASGALTRGEADTLGDNLYWIKSTHARMKADGRLNPAEIRKLDGMLDRNGAMIFSRKHNPITRVYQADIPERIADQQWRIDQGIASGALTRGEVDILNDNLYWIKSTHARMKADGRLTPAEIGKLDGMLDRTSAMIFDRKHNPIARVYQADIPERIADQQRRIDQGIASGTLTRGEADIINDNLYWIKSTHARMKADGRLNPAEIRKLDEMLDRNGAMIYNKKHNSPGRVY